jgi:hypothetical protein
LLPAFFILLFTFNKVRKSLVFGYFTAGTPPSAVNARLINAELVCRFFERFTVAYSLVHGGLLARQ